MLEQAECEINITLIHYYSCIDASATERASKTKYTAAPTPTCQVVLVTSRTKALTTEGKKQQVEVNQWAKLD